MFEDEDEKIAGALLIFIVGAVVAGIFGFAIYQSGALGGLTGDQYVIGSSTGADNELSKIDADVVGDGLGIDDAALVVGAGSAMVDTEGEVAVVVYDHKNDIEHQQIYGEHSHDGQDTIAKTEAGITPEAIKQAHLDALHPAQDLNAIQTEISDQSGAALKIEDGVAKFYFATGKAQVIDGAAQTIEPILQQLRTGEKMAVLSGFVDPRGSQALNEELAKNRAKAVRDLLVQNGVTIENIELRKPSDIVPEGVDYSELRRVELTLEDR